MTNPENEQTVDARRNGENLMQAMGDIFHGSESSERQASADQVLTIAMGKLQGLGLMALYYELRHGNELQLRQTLALERLTEELQAQNEIARAGGE